jgi:hypothetical protein
MTLSIDIPAELEQRLKDEASRRGIEPAEYARLLLQDHLPRTGAVADSPADFDRALDEFFAANPEKLPPLPPDFSRADIYAEHD